MARKYLTHFAFKNQGNLSAFKKKGASYLSQYMIEDIENKTQIYLSRNGMEGLRNNKSITVDLFKQISDQVNLTFCDHNKEKFSVQESVELHLDIKNVQTLHVKVFEFNTLTYYRKNLKPFDTGLDLDGLESSITKKFEFNDPPNVKRQETFKFDELIGKVGLFIVEFLGNGRSARAVVKKGSLSLIHRSTVAG